MREELLKLFEEFELAAAKYNQTKPAFEDTAELTLANFIKWLRFTTPEA